MPQKVDIMRWEGLFTLSSNHLIGSVSYILLSMFLVLLRVFDYNRLTTKYMFSNLPHNVL